MSRILALDYGQKRIGVAISDELGIIASSVGFIANKGKKHFIPEIKDLCQKHSVAKMIVGLPKSLSGDHTQQTVVTEKFIKLLKAELEVTIEDVDERLTSVMAKQFATGKGKRHKDEDIDSAAARVMLQDYLDRIKNK